VVVPLSPMLRGQGLTSLLNDSDSAAVFINAAFAEHLTPLKSNLPNIPADRYILTDANNVDGYRVYHFMTAAASDQEPPATKIVADDPYNIIYSSGTTGLPKGIVHTHYIRSAYCTSFGSAYRITPESVILHSGSIVFNGAFLTLMPAMFLASTYILHSHFNPEAMIETIEKEKVTHIMMVPSQIIALLHSPEFSPEKLHSVEMICSVGAPFHREHKDELHHRLPGRFYELYGLTEGFVTILDKEDYARKPDSVGTPPPFFEMRIVGEGCQDLPSNEVGEIVGRGPITMPGYYKRPDLTAQAIKDGWLYSGDLGYVDEDGFLYLVDRKKDLIISGGINVYPKDIEEIIVQHPAVHEVAVFGIPSEKWGETPLALVRQKQVIGLAIYRINTWKLMRSIILDPVNLPVFLDAKNQTRPGRLNDGRFPTSDHRV